MTDEDETEMTVREAGLWTLATVGLCVILLLVAAFSACVTYSQPQRVETFAGFVTAVEGGGKTSESLPGVPSAEGILGNLWSLLYWVAAALLLSWLLRHKLPVWGWLTLAPVRKRLRRPKPLPPLYP